MNRLLIRKLLLTSALVSLPAVLVAQTGPQMIDLGTLAPGDPSQWSEAYSVTPDGRVIIGRSRTPDGDNRVYRWTAEEGMVDLGTLRSDGSGYSYTSWWGWWGHAERRGMTADGSVVVGEASTDDGTNRGFRWTEATGMVDLGSLRSDGLGYSYAHAVSEDGRLVAGTATAGSGDSRAALWHFNDPSMPASFVLTDLGSLRSDGTGWAGVYMLTADGTVAIGQSSTDDNRHRAFRWTEAAGMVDLGSLYSPTAGDSHVQAMSADGNVLAGDAQYASGSSRRAALWTFDSTSSASFEIVELGTLRSDGAGWAHVYGLTADGTVAVGHSDTDSGHYRAFRWTETTGMVDLGSLDGGDYSYAQAMSADGTVIAGYAHDATAYRAVLWRFAATSSSDFDLVSLGTLTTDGSGESEARMMTADARVVVGRSRTDDGNSRAFRWTEAEGMRDLGSLRSDGLGYSYAYHMTPDGSVIVGYADTDEDRSRAFAWRGSMVDLENTAVQLQQTAAAIGAAAAQASFAAQTRLGTELDVHRDEVTTSSQGTAAAVDAAPARAPVALSIGAGLVRNGDVGTRGSVDLIAATALPGGYTLGGFVELGRATSTRGPVELDGPQVAGGISLRYRANADFSGLTWRVAAMAESGRADITRMALLPGTMAGTGNARITTAAASVEIGQGFATASGVVIPYARLSHARTTRAAYDEVAATGFPLSFDRHEDKATTLTLGVDSRMAVGPQGTLRLGAGVSHDLDRSTGTVHGTSAIPGFTSFDVAGPALENRTRLHLEASYSHRLAAGGAITGSAGIAQSPWSDKPSVGARVSYDIRF